MKYAVLVLGHTFEIEVQEGRVLVDGRRVAGALVGRSGTARRRLERGALSRGFVAHPAEPRGAWRLSCDGQRIDALVLDPRERAIRTAAGPGGAAHRPGAVRAPMPGLVVRVLADEGATVAGGQGLVVIEAMKMENELTAAGAGTVSKVHVKPGDRVEKGALLVELA